ncbi:MAG: CoA transferase [Chloroflexi bacterium]|nr:CoA transferase [Chloroflexota bacterium]
MVEIVADGTEAALTGIRVLDLAGPMGQPCGRILGDLGADVIKVEPPGGDPARGLGPFAGDIEDPERSIFFLHFNANKRSLVLDLTAPEGREMFLRLVRTADVVLESFPPGHLAELGLSYEELKRANPGIVVTSITPFGQTGPYRDFKGTDFIAVAMGGMAFPEGDPGNPPFTQPHYQAYQQAGRHAVFATLVSLRERRTSGQGQHVDVSVQEVAAHHSLQLVDYSSVQEITERTVGILGRRGVANYYPCRDDRWVLISFFRPQQRAALAEWIDDPVASDLLRDPPTSRGPNPVLVNRIAAFVGRFDREEFLAEATRRRLPASAMNSIVDFVEHPHTKERRFLIEIEHPVVGKYRAPGAPSRFNRTPWRVTRAAPLLGQHTREILAEIGRPIGQRQGAGRADGKATSGLMPLQGIRVLDFGRAWAAPFATRYLADFGAEVIKVESTKFPDLRQLAREPNINDWRRNNGGFDQINRNKRSITVDLHDERGRALVSRLVGMCDVVVENYHPAALPEWGFGYGDLRKIRPDIIMVSSPAYGSSGPLRDNFGMGTSITAFAGMADLWGVPEAPRYNRSKNPFPDFIAASDIALAAMAALHYRDRTGLGQHVEVAQVESTAASMGTACLEYLVNGVVPQPRGNRDVNAAPQGIYPCRGDDRWCALSCTAEDEWHSLCRVIGNPAWTETPIFTTRELRRRHHDALDEHIASWTRQHSPHQVMYLCQREGVPAGVVANGEDMYLDPHMRQRGYIIGMEHPAPGWLEQLGVTVRLSRTPGMLRSPAPGIGSDNEYVFGALLGMGEEEWIKLIAEGVLV